MPNEQTQTTEPGGETQSQSATTEASAKTADAGTGGGDGGGNGDSSAGQTEGKEVGNGAASGDWKAGLNSDISASPSLKDIKTVDDLAKQFIDSQAFIGNSIRIPSEHASDEDKQAFRAKLLERVPGLAEVSTDSDAFTATMRQLGAPEEAKGYKLPELEGDNLTPIEGFNEWAHEANMTQSQFDIVAKRFTEAQVAASETQAANHNADMEGLHKDWGYAFDEKRTQAINTAKLTGMPDDFITAMEANRVPVQWLKAMAGLADKFGPDGDIGDVNAQRKGEMTTSEAQAQHDEVMNNREHPYWTARQGSPEKKRAIDMVLKLKERAMGKGSRAPVVTFGYGEE